MSLDLEKSEKPTGPLKRTDNDYPVAWVRTQGLGRVFYSSLGHNVAVYADPRILGFWLRGIQYALGDLKAETAARPKP